MISEYHRPTTLEEALALLARDEPLSIPMAGGSVVNQPSREVVEVVDLQALGLDTLEPRGKSLDLGATLSLQNLQEHIEAKSGGDFPAAGALVKAIRHEASYNLRQVASVAGTLVAANGRSPFTTAMLALDAALTIQPGDETLSLGDLLPVRAERLRGRLITQATIPSNVRLAYEYVARTPADQAIISVAGAMWPSGRTRVALGGWGEAPRLAFDGTEADGVKAAVQSAASQAGDEWGSAEYRQDVAAILAGRCLEQLAP